MPIFSRLTFAALILLTGIVLTVSAAAQNSALEAFADKIVVVKTAAELNDIFAENPHLLTAELGQILIARGDDFRTKSEFDNALAAFRAAQMIAEKSADSDSIAEAMGRQGAVYRFKGDYERALELLEPALTRYQTSNNNAGIGMILNNIGAVSYFRGDYQKAEEIWRQSLAAREKTGNRKDINQSLSNLGALYTATGRIDDALDVFKRTSAVARDLRDDYQLAASLNNIGDVLSEQGDYRQAMEFLLEALAINEKRENKLDASLVLNNIGQIYYSQGNYERAALYYERARSLREAVGDQQGLAVTLMHLGMVRAANREFAAALALVKQSFALREKIGDKRGIAIALNNLGRIELRAGNTAAALRYFERSLTQYETSSYKDGIAQTRNNIARANLDLGNASAAAENATRAVNLARETGARETLWLGLSVLGQAQNRLGQTAAAEKTLRESVRVIESVRDNVTGDALDRQQFFQNKIEPYHELIGMMVRAENNSAALEFAERAKARVLLDILQTGQNNAGKNLSESERAAEKNLKSAVYVLENDLRRAAAKPNAERSALAALQTKLDAARTIFDSFNGKLDKAHPELKLRRGETGTVDAAILKTLLPGAETILLEYVVAENQTFLFAVTNGAAAPQIEVLPIAVGRADLNKIVAAFHDKLARRDLRFADDARKLYNLLFAPAARLIENKNRIIIAPDAALWELPFQALLDRQNKYVVESAAVSYAPSFGVLAEIERRQTPSNNATLLAFGNPAHQFVKKPDAKNSNPVLQSGEFADLPEAARQVEALKKLYSADRAKVLIGAAATESEFKRSAQNYRVLHFATHGVLDDASPLYSYVLLADDPKNKIEDGRLEAWELLQMNLNADLIVLSACETARGQISEGEGLVGLSWAFFVAGAPTTIASQWKVESASTTDLMLGFYRRLSAPKTAKSVVTAEALRQSALVLLKSEKYSHPFYWAGFVVVGRGD